MDKVKTDVSSLFLKAKEDKTFLRVCAPMVRYSKVQFRSLVKKYGVDLCFTPMILADSFCQSSKARHSEFTTSVNDTPLVVQFAAKTIHDFVGASELVFPYADGVDLNCGCPQRWAMKDGYGCSLLNEPEIIHSLVRTFKNHLPSSFSVSVKIRLLKDLKQTIELCRSIENCGVNFITVHGRKSWQRNSDPVDSAVLKAIKHSLNVPLIANGNVKNLEDAIFLQEESNADGIMTAQGILTNPGLFTGEKITPMSCVQDWLNICASEKSTMTFQCFHHHLVFMLEKILTKPQKRVFNYLTSYDDVHNFLDETYGLKPQLSNIKTASDEIVCSYSTYNYSTLPMKYDSEYTINSNCTPVPSDYSSSLSNGKYFESTISQDYCDLDNMESSLFNEE